MASTTRWNWCKLLPLSIIRPVLSMQFVIKLFPEINLKSQSIQRRLTAILQSNVHQILSRFDPDVVVKREWDKLIVSSGVNSAATAQQYVQALVDIPGIQTILEVEVQPFADLDDILRHTLAIWAIQLPGKSFCVRARRSGQHPFSSLQVQRFVGAGLLAACAGARVDLHQPECLVQLEVVQQTLYLVRATHKGLGGYPLATQDDVLCMLSGGYDSAVAAFQFIKRGCRVHYCFFNLGGDEHLRGVQQMAYLLWSRYSSTHKVQLIAVDFAGVVNDIVQHIPLGNQGVVLKRQMLRAAQMLARRLQAPAVVSGEAVGQVASQTLANLQVIDQVSTGVVLRPLASLVKPVIFGFVVCIF
ncbi:MAG: thiamine biosynthesis protein ThiI, partial [Pseudomonadota bacterium]